jgi:hypothetical protein
MRNDRQAISDSQSSLLQHNNNMAFFQTDQSFKEFIKSNLKRPKVSKEFIQSIKDKIKVA